MIIMEATKKVNGDTTFSAVIPAKIGINMEDIGLLKDISKSFRKLYTKFMIEDFRYLINVLEDAGNLKIKTISMGRDIKRDLKEKRKEYPFFTSGGELIRFIYYTQMIKLKKEKEKKDSERRLNEQSIRDLLRTKK